MVTAGRAGRFLALALLSIFIAAQVITGTATFAGSGENEESSKTFVRETAEDEIYKSENLNILAQEYNVEMEYLKYIAEVEKTFELEPYELLALIAQESEFIPQTKMDGGSFSYSTTQMKLDTAKTAYIAITEYYHKDIPAPSHELLAENKYYAAMLAGGYLKYLHDTYQDKYESYTAYHRGIRGRLEFYEENGHYQSSYALKIADLNSAFAQGKTRSSVDKQQ